VNSIKIKTSGIAAIAITCFVAFNCQAANWLMLQGTEPDSAAARAYLWGFVQVQYQKDNSDANSSDGYIPPKLIGPNLESQQQFNVNRARIGVRGTGFPLDGKTNYFLLTEFGNNAITAPGDTSARVTDASITFNHIPRARIRAGLFKTPGAEEGLQAIHVFDYVNFTTVTNQLLLERFPNKSYTPNNDPISLPSSSELGGFDRSVGAFRDVGVQVFDTIVMDDWEHTYAFMLGNGNGLNFGDNDDSLDQYLYWSSEKVFAGQGPRRQGMKLFAWNQSGERVLDNTNDATPNPTSFDRDRSGFGFKYLKGQYRFSAEYMKGEGMIFVGPDKPTFYINDAAGAVAQNVGNGAEGEADGWYVEGGWYIPDTKWEIHLRYDVYNRLTNDNAFAAGPNAGKSFEMEFTTLTLGTQYHINRKTRMNIEIANRDYEAVDFDSGAGPNDNLDGVDQRFAIQLTHIF
jgi:hypothetical protein